MNINNIINNDSNSNDDNNSNCRREETTKISDVGWLVQRTSLGRAIYRPPVMPIVVEILNFIAIINASEWFELSTTIGI